MKFSKKLLKGGALFKSSLEKGNFLGGGGKNQVKMGTFWAVGTWNGNHFNMFAQLEKGIISKPVSHMMGIHFDTQWTPRIIRIGVLEMWIYFKMLIVFIANTM
jgi:hypothetical protein